MTKTILFVLTSADAIGKERHPTGFHYEEMTTPYFIFKDAGFDVVLASVQGGKPPHDPGSFKNLLSENAESVQRFVNDKDASTALEQTLKASDIRVEDYDALYLPGGHGTMADYPGPEGVADIVSAFFSADKPVSAVCHGIAGFIGAKKADGTPLVQGKRINCFTDAEEIKVELEDVVPFMLETAVKEQGAIFESSGLFQAHVAEDGLIITGQNPASAQGVAERIVSLLNKQSSSKAA